jgi:hypothetical protein
MCIICMSYSLENYFSSIKERTYQECNGLFRFLQNAPTRQFRHLIMYILLKVCNWFTVYLFESSIVIMENGNPDSVDFAVQSPISLPF